MKNVKNQSAKPKTLFFRNLKGISVYLCCIGTALFLMYYFEGDAGMLLAIGLGCALGISLAVTLIVRPFIRITVTTDTASAVKGDEIIYRIHIDKKIPIPTPVIELHTECTPHFLKETDSYSVTLGFRQGNKTEHSLVALHSGVGEIRLSEVIISDYLGVFCFRLKHCMENTAITLSVYPNIPDVAVQTNFLKTAVLFSGNDDEEEETDETAQVQTGFPGYDHREYYPGDPVKRINWKLSSKRDIYMIRLDEKMAGTGQLFFLDMPFAQQNEYNLSVRDNIIEGILAVFHMIIQEGNEIIFFFPQNEKWQKFELHRTEDIHTLQELSVTVTPIANGRLIPKELVSNNKTPICFTTATAENPTSAMQIVADLPNVLLVSSELAHLPKITPEMWQLTKEWELQKY